MESLFEYYWNSREFDEHFINMIDTTLSFCDIEKDATISVVVRNSDLNSVIHKIGDFFRDKKGINISKEEEECTVTRIAEEVVRYAAELLREDY